MQKSFLDQFSELKNSSAFPAAQESTSTPNSQNASASNATSSKVVASTKNIAAVLVNPKQFVTSELKDQFKFVTTDEKHMCGKMHAQENEGSSTCPFFGPVAKRGNPLLKSITSTAWQFDDTIIPDYVMSRTTCALFLSLKYHNLKPDYINERLKQLGKLYDLRVLLVQVDLEDPHHALKHLTRVCLLCDLTLMLAWSSSEAGKIIETYKIYENKPPDMIMERQESDAQLKIMNALTSIRSVNRTDAATLLSTFGSLRNIVRASKESLSLCPGIGPQKAAKIQQVLKQPFLRNKKRKLTSPKEDITCFLKKSSSS